MSQELIKIYRCRLDDGCLESWICDSVTREPIRPEKDIPIEKQFSIYKNEQNQEMAVSAPMKEIVNAIVYEQLLDLGLIDTKEKK